jgi:FkbM family methyltransferase
VRRVRRLVHSGNEIGFVALMRNLKMHWRRWRNLETLRIRGVLVGTAKATTPHSVRNALFKGVYEEHECDIVERIVRRGDRILEIGAGIGLVSLLATRLAGEGRVLSCEANPALELVIRANYALNGWTPNLRMGAVAASSGTVTFHQNDNLLSSSRIDRKLSGKAISVEANSMDELLKAHDANIIVMDVEGSETELLASADLSGVKSIIVEMHPHIVGEDEIAKLVAKLKADGFAVKEQRHKTYLLQRA